MSRILALSSQMLSRYHYHWFWGLSISLPNQPSLYDDVKKLRENPAELKALIDQVFYVQSQYRIIIFFYWIFNIDQYSKNYCQLHGYASLELYDQGVSMLSESEQKLAKGVGCFLILSGVGFVLSRFSQPYFSNFTAPILSNIEWFSTRISNIQPINPTEVQISSGENLNEGTLLLRSNPKQLYSNTIALTLNTKEVEKSMNIVSSDIEHYFLVTSSMLPALKILGIQSPVGAQVAFNTLKNFYRKKLLATHPDKTHSGTDKNFHDVRSALQTILSEISKPSNNLRDTVDFSEFVFKFAMRELFSIFIVRTEGVRKMLSQELENWQLLRKQYKENMDARLSQRDRLAYQQQGLLTQGEKYCAGVESFSEGVDQLTQETLELKNVLRAFQNGQLSARKVSGLFQAADRFGGFTKLPFYDAQKPNPNRFFETLSDTSSDEGWILVERSDNFSV